MKPQAKVGGKSEIIEYIKRAPSVPQEDDWKKFIPLIKSMSELTAAEICEKLNRTPWSTIQTRLFLAILKNEDNTMLISDLFI